MRIVLLIFIVMLCASCASSQRAVRQDLHTKQTAVVDSTAVRSAVQSALTNIIESEDLLIVIEEFKPNAEQGGSDSAQISERATSTTPYLARRITIDRSTHRNTHSESQSQTTDTLCVARADSSQTDTQKTTNSEVVVNKPDNERWHSILLFAGIIFMFYVTIKKIFRKEDTQ